MGISYFDVWKKKMENNGGDITQSRINTSKDFFNRNFKDDPSYKLATLRKKDNSIVDSDLDTRIVNVDTNTNKKKIYVRPDTNIEVGDYIIYSNKTYLALEVEDNLISPYASATECNHKFKWMYKGVLNEAYGIGTNQTKYTLGTDSVQAGIVESDSRYAIDLPNCIKCKTIKVGQRLIFNEGAWKVTQVEYVSSKDNIRSILLGQDNINFEIDDVENEIAGKWANKHTYTYNTPTNFEVAKDNTYQLLYSIKDETGKDFDYSLVTATTTNNTLVNITNNKGVITIKGIGIGVGSIKLSVPIGETTKDFDISFEVKAIVADKITYETNFSQGTSIKQYVTSILVVTKYLNGVKDSAPKISYSFDTLGQTLIANKKIIVSQTGDNLLSIKNALINATTVIHLSVIDSVSGEKILDNEPITFIKGI